MLNPRVSKFTPKCPEDLGFEDGGNDLAEALRAEPVRRHPLAEDVSKEFRISATASF
jgi:hypothetical protein